MKNVDEEKAMDGNNGESLWILGLERTEKKQLSWVLLGFSFSFCVCVWEWILYSLKTTTTQKHN
jgi:hypothetical protein